ncbi:hypothetical protein JCM19237_2670 [Photobacterium aphoticum]|uniref:Uncharacterized protein n=1 Tax=Photobacterium aphoticum TaxID=754436 RepID=A0A090QWE0_9GAMM|nr:hypothetical protein JCM19237_2670 [Photobacterium aphoticum]
MFYQALLRQVLLHKSYLQIHTSMFCERIQYEVSSIWAVMPKGQPVRNRLAWYV